MYSKMVKWRHSEALSSFLQPTKYFFALGYFFTDERENPKGPFKSIETCCSACDNNHHHTKEECIVCRETKIRKVIS